MYFWHWKYLQCWIATSKTIWTQKNAVQSIKYISRAAYLFSNFGRRKAVMHEKSAQGSQKSLIIPKLICTQKFYIKFISNWKKIHSIFFKLALDYIFYWKIKWLEEHVGIFQRISSFFEAILFWLSSYCFDIPKFTITKK